MSEQDEIFARLRDRNMHSKREVQGIYAKAEKEKSKAFLSGWVTGAIGMIALTEIILPSIASLF